MRTLTLAELAVLIFNLAYLTGGLLASLRGSNTEFVMYVAVLSLLLMLVAVVHFRVGLPLIALWGLSLWGVAHMAGGLWTIPESWLTDGTSRVLYNVWLIPDRLRYDQVVHAYGFGLVTWVCWLGLKAAFAQHQVEIRPTVGLLSLCVAGGMGFGAANEVVEFFATLLIPETNVGGYMNTGWDLVANAAGSIVVAGLILMWPARRTDIQHRGES